MLHITVLIQDQVQEFKGKFKQLKKIGKSEWLELEELGAFPLQDVVAVNGIQLY